MELVKKLTNLGIVNGGVADILLDGQEQLAFIKNYRIDIQKDKHTKYRCVVFPNNGRRVFKSPVLSYSETSGLQGASLQVGVFTLLQFRNLAPLLPTPVENFPDKIYLNLYSIPWQTFNIESLVKEYNVVKIYEEFLKMNGEYRESQAAFLQEYDRKKSMARKAAEKGESDPSISLEKI